MNTYKNIALILFGLIIIFLCYNLWNKKTKIEYVTLHTKSIDTVFKEVITQGKKVYIKGDAIIEYKPFYIENTIIDTVFETKPFRACLDTVQRDTISICYEYPENKFQYVLKPVPDTLKIPEINIIKEYEPKWYNSNSFLIASNIISLNIGLSVIFIMSMK